MRRAAVEVETRVAGKSTDPINPPHPSSPLRQWPMLRQSPVVAPTPQKRWWWCLVSVVRARREPRHQAVLILSLQK